MSRIRAKMTHDLAKIRFKGPDWPLPAGTGAPTCKKVTVVEINYARSPQGAACVIEPSKKMNDRC